VIVNWNAATYLERCLDALHAQTVAPYEIILVDNASTDGSLGQVLRFPGVRVLAQSENLGFARGNNVGIEAAAAESDWIALLNPDAFPAPGWLEALLCASRENTAFDFFGSTLLNAAEPALLDGAGDAYHVSGRVWRIGLGYPAPLSPGPAYEIFSPCAAAALYRRSALAAVNGFDEDFFCYVEDVDLGFRLRLTGYRCLHVPASVAHHVGSGTTGGRHSDFSVYHGHRNLVWAYFKNMPPLLFWVFLPLHLAMNLGALLVGALRGQGGVLLRAKRDAVISIPKMWSKRKLIQSHRVVSWRAIFKVMKMI